MGFKVKCLKTQNNEYLIKRVKEIDFNKVLERIKAR